VALPTASGGRCGGGARWRRTRLTLRCVIGLVLRADQIGAAAGIIAAVAGVVAAVFAIRGCRATNRNAAVQLGNWRSEIRADLSATAFPPGPGVASLSCRVSNAGGAAQPAVIGYGSSEHIYGTHVPSVVTCRLPSNSNAERLSVDQKMEKPASICW
jgi:hypothetical protein